jgi:peptidyl-prolyl cis-trans isomerase SurA
MNYKKILLLHISLLIFALDCSASDYLVPTFTNISETAKNKRAFKLDENKICQDISIVAVVNGEPITSAELKDRMLMMTNGDLSKIPHEHLHEAKKTILNQLINERIQLQTIKLAGMAVDDNDIDRAIEHAEQQNNMKPGQMINELSSKGVSQKTIRQHFAAKVGWYRFISNYYRGLIEVSNADIKGKELPQSKRSPKYHLAEIVINYDSFTDEEQALSIASQIHQQLVEGRHFSETAMATSTAPSAANGGDIGWIVEEQLQPEIRSALKSMEPSQLSPPIKAGNAYKIILFRNIKYPDNKSETVDVRQLDIKISDKISQEEKEAEVNRINDMFELIENCQEFEKAAEQIETSQLHVYKDVSLPELSTDLQKVIKDLKLNKASKGIESNDSVVYFMVCNRSMKVAEKIEEEQYDKIASSRLNAIANQKIHDLRRTASVDVRI